MIQIDQVKLMQGDCLELMQAIPDGSVDMILCDLPYGTTKNKWDCVIPVKPLWEEYKRILKHNGVTVLTATPPFSAMIASENIDNFRYSWYWQKSHTGQFNAKYTPLKNVEECLVFYTKQPTYNPQFEEGKPYHIIRKNYKGSECYGTQRDHESKSDGKRYPKQIIKYTKFPDKREHPTQKPVALLEYLIKTYTNQGEVVLDNCMGSGSTGVACINTGRQFIGIEKDGKWFDVARNRIEQALKHEDYFSMNSDYGLVNLTRNRSGSD